MWIRVSKIKKSPTTASWKDIDPKDKAILSKFCYDNGMISLDEVNIQDSVLLIGKFHTKVALDRLEELKNNLPQWQARKKYMEENNVISTTIYEGPEEDYDPSKYL